MDPASVLWADDGRVMFDSRWPQLARVAKGRITANSQAITFAGGTVPVVAFRPINCNAAIETQTRSGSTFTYNFLTYQRSSGFYIDYWIYDRIAPTKPTSGNNLALFDASGNCTFDITKTPMAIARQASQPSGRTYAIAPAPGPAWRQTAQERFDSKGNLIDIIYTLQMGGWSFNGSTFSTQMFGASADIGQGTYEGGYDPAANGYVILDVTNH